MHEIIAKKILSPQGGINIYRGCTHNCIYCDARSNCYQNPYDFNDIGIKVNAINLLEKELSKKRKKIMVHTGAMCDPYLHVEKEYELTKKMLEVILKYRHGVSILTKSDLVLRDLELLKQINQNARAVVALTITTFDDNLTKLIEPNAPSTKRRFEALRIIANAGIPTGIWLGPILPFINDNKENIISIIDKAHEVGVKYIICFDMGVTLRDGDREYFYMQLDKSFPGLKKIYQQTYGLNYICSSIRANELMQIFYKKCHEYNIICTVDEGFRFEGDIGSKVEQLSLFE